MMLLSIKADKTERLVNLYIYIEMAFHNSTNLHETKVFEFKQELIVQRLLETEENVQYPQESCDVISLILQAFLFRNSNSIYMHNWPLQPFSQDYNLASHTTHVLCINFIPEWRDLQFNVASERQIFEKLFNSRFIDSPSFCQKPAERKSPKKYFFLNNSTKIPVAHVFLEIAFANCLTNFIEFWNNIYETSSFRPN